jgi:hypothetical protein
LKLSTTSFAAGAVAALVIGSGSAYAATGGSFILGKSNSAGATTSLSNANGTALSLNSKSGTASLKVNRTTKVTNLNADLLDGADISAFARATMGTGSFDAVATASDEDGDGTLETFAALATCPSATLMTGGGIVDFTATGYTLINGPAGGNSWLVVVGVDPSVDADPTDVAASVTCLNPKGAVAGSYRAAPSPAIPHERIAAAVAARAAH